MTVEELEFGCTRCHCWPVGAVFTKEALKLACCGFAGAGSMGTVTDAGATETRMPESKPIVAVPVFFLSASDVAVKVSTGTGFGKLASVGAV